MSMRGSRWMTGLGLGALGAAGTLIAPALQAQGNAAVRLAAVGRATGLVLPGTFTPAAANPKLAALVTRGAMADGGLRFTPSGVGSRSAALAQRARVLPPVLSVSRPTVAASQAVSLAPIAYNLGVSAGWKRFAVAGGDIGRLSAADKPGLRDRADLGTVSAPSRMSGRIQAAPDRSPADAPAIGDKPNYSIDVGGSYSLTRNFDFTAGVRYRNERERLPKMADDRRDSQSVYVGTAFRF
jgi:hypothetical protein